VTLSSPAGISIRLSDSEIKRYLEEIREERGEDEEEKMGK
jgi:hypothetical protein